MCNKTLCGLLSLVFACPTLAQETIESLGADPMVIRLAGPQASFSLLIDGKTSGGQLVDLTRDAKYHSAEQKIVTVSPTGLVRSVRRDDGDSGRRGGQVGERESGSARVGTGTRLSFRK